MSQVNFSFHMTFLTFFKSSRGFKKHPFLDASDGFRPFSQKVLNRFRSKLKYIINNYFFNNIY